MAGDVNLADPSFEPTDEQLELLAHEAFAGVSARHVEALARLRSQIATLRAEALRYVAELSTEPAGR